MLMHLSKEFQFVDVNSVVDLQPIALALRISPSSLRGCVANILKQNLLSTDEVYILSTVFKMLIS